MLDKNIKLSVIIPIYNRIMYYKEALASIEAQNFTDFSSVEVVIVSNIKLNDEFAQYKFTIKLLYSKDTSLSAKIIEGLNNSSGDIILLLEDDDIFNRYKFMYIKKAFYENDNLNFYHNNYIHFHNNSKDVNIDKYEKYNTVTINRSKFINSYKAFNLIENKMSYNLSCMAFRKSFIKSHANILLNFNSSFIDSVMFFIATRYADSVAIDDNTLTYVRIHSENASGIRSAMDKLDFYNAFESFKLPGNNDIINIHIDRLVSMIEIDNYIKLHGGRVEATRLFFKYFHISIKCHMKPSLDIIVKFLLFILSYKILHKALKVYHT